MKIVYHCYGGAHSSVTAAAVHLGWLPSDRIPTAEELIDIPYFDRSVDQDHGNIRFMGTDQNGHEIYVVGRRNAVHVFENMVTGLTDIYQPSAGQFVFIDVMPYVNWKMVLGGFTSRRMGWTQFGRPVITNGVKTSYWKIVSVVNRIKTGLVSGLGG